MKAPRPPSNNTPVTQETSSGLIFFTYPWLSWLSKLWVFLRAVLRVNSTSTTASAGSQTLPANPVGFIVTQLEDGTEVKIPYYDP